VDAREDLDEGRLAGPVLAEQGVHLPGADLEVDAVQARTPGKTLTTPLMRSRG
jgi:hypothetical protein